jgi:very-short-patch-repair endonuclease
LSDVVTSGAILRASNEWRSALIDVGGNNRLLYFKPNASTIDLTSASQAGVAKLLSGATVRLSELFSDATTLRLAQRACTALARKQREATEEFGVSVAYLAVGLATWDPEGNEAVAAAEVAELTSDASKPATRPKYLNPSAPVLLRPLELSLRKGAQDSWELRLDEDFQLNGVLEHVMNADLDRLDAEEILLSDDGITAGVDEMLDEVEAACDDVPGFTVDRKMFLGAFSYLKQPMVNDIDDLDALAASDLVSALAGDPGAAERIRAHADDVTEESPDYEAVESEFLVLDADASQSFVVNAALAGRNLVVEGPPGTGKSQTIANVIAAMVAAGKSVLFVAQKRAAVTAVLDRLDSESVDLSHVVLDLFASVASRRYVAEQLREVLDRQRTTGVPNVDVLHYNLKTARDRLVSHKDALVARRGWGPSVADLRILALDLPLSAQTNLRLPASTFEQWSTTDLQRYSQAINELHDIGALAPSWNDSAGWNPSVLTTSDAVVTNADLLSLTSGVQLPKVKKLIGSLANEMGEAIPNTWSALDILLGRLDEIDGIMKASPGVLDPLLTDTELTAMLLATNRELRRTSPIKLSWGERRVAMRSARALAPNMARKPLHALLRRAKLAKEQWRGHSGLSGIASRDVTRCGYQQLLAGLRDLQPAVQHLDLATLPIPELEQALDRLTAQRSLATMPRAFELESALDAGGCARIVSVLRDHLASGKVLGSTAGELLKWVAIRSVLDDAVLRSPALAGITGADLDAAAANFQEADAEHLAANAARIRRIAAENLKHALDSHPDQHALLKTEVTRKKNFRAVRTLFRDAPDVLLAAKPVWAMSPLQVSRMLPAVACFDVVIFDEASQVKPADGIPSLLRAKQAIIAGDSRQLPPTEFFAKVLDDLPTKGDQDELEALVDEEQSELDHKVEVPKRRPPAESFTRDAESILFAMDRVLAGQSRRLLWHYRSRDERLIAVSNAYVYDNSLTTFPAADSADALRHVAVHPSRGIRNTTNSPEAEVAEVIALMREQVALHPDESVGVITFGEAHQRRIESALELALHDDAEFLAALTANQAEPYFVKNIERVQGDERDAIILTVGYGKGLDGKLRYFWGPLLKEGGERRLNVAISRAKRRLTLVTSFTADDVPDDGHDSAGFKLMYRFLRFMASNGEELAGGPSRSTTLNAFEIDVRDRLQAAGLQLDPQVGVGSYRIDFAARHPTLPGRYVLAIEADGASYHSGHVARERDRLRQTLLERRGWVFHRIWSTDWFNDAPGEVAKVQEAFNNAVARDNEADQHLEETVAATPSESWTISEGARTYPLPHFRAGLPITEYPWQVLVHLVRHIRSDQLLGSADEEIGEAMTLLGFRKRGTRIVAAIAAAQRYVDRETGK